MDSEEDVMFARSPLDSPMGKLGKAFKTDVDFGTGEAFEERCRQAGTTPSAMLREHVYELIHGKTYSDICHDEAKIKRNAVFSKRSDGSVLGASS